MIIKQKRYWNLNSIYLKTWFYFIVNWSVSSVYPLISSTKKGSSARVRECNGNALTLWSIQSSSTGSIQRIKKLGKSVQSSCERFRLTVSWRRKQLQRSTSDNENPNMVHHLITSLIWTMHLLILKHAQNKCLNFESHRYFGATQFSTAKTYEEVVLAAITVKYLWLTPVSVDHMAISQFSGQFRQGVI